MEDHIRSLLWKAKRHIPNDTIGKTYRDLLKDAEKRALCVVTNKVNDKVFTIYIANHLFEVTYSVPTELVKRIVSGNTKMLFDTIIAIMEITKVSKEFSEKCIESFSQSLIDNNYAIHYFNDCVEEPIKVYMFSVDIEVVALH